MLHSLCVLCGLDFKKARKVELEIVNEGTRIVHVTMLYANNFLFFFSYIHPDSLTEEAADEKKRFFNSIKPSKRLSFKDQLTVSEAYSANYQKGKEWALAISRYLWPSLLTTGAIAILLLLFLYFKFQKR